MKKFLAIIATLVVAVFAFAGCGGSPSASSGSDASASSGSGQKVLKVGASPVPHAEILEVVKPLLAKEGIDLQIVKLPEAKQGFVLLPRRWVLERSFGWLARFRRLSRDYERLPQMLAGLHFLIFVMLMLPRALPALATGVSS